MPKIKTSPPIQSATDTLWARIVIVAYNSGPDLKKCVESLAAQTCQSFEAVIVDNASTDRAVKDLKLPNDRYSLLSQSENIGFAKGSNRGADGTMTPWIITLNPDSWPQPTWLEELRKAHHLHPDYAFLSSTIIQNDFPDKLDCFGDFLSVFGVARNAGRDQPFASRPRQYCEVFSPSGAAAAYRADIFSECGGFDEDFFCYLEDVDLGYRMRLRGEVCLQCPDAVVRHIGSSTVGKHSDFKYYYTYRNNVGLVIKNTPWPLLLIVSPLFFASQIWWLHRNRHNPGANARAKGILDGIKSMGRALEKRKTIQKERDISSRALLARLSWSISDLRRQKILYWSLNSDD